MRLGGFSLSRFFFFLLFVCCFLFHVFCFMLFVFVFVFCCCCWWWRLSECSFLVGILLCRVCTMGSVVSTIVGV